jgi:maltose alpha-D-glucosyltransferase/alpha-amylase
VLAANTRDPAFAPTLFTGLSARSAYHRMRTTAVAVTARLRRAHARIAPPLQSATAVVMDGQERALGVFREVLTCAVGAIRIRCHGNLHLAQLLTVGDDLLFVDFEGEPGRPVYERRLKHSPLLDAASMIRSFDYAADAAIRGLAGSTGSTDEASAGRARDWRRRVSSLFLETYTAAVQDTNLLPADPRRARALLDAYLLERTFFELGAELSGEAQSLAVPLGAIRDQLASA